MNLWSLLVMVYGTYRMGLLLRKVDFVAWEQQRGRSGFVIRSLQCIISRLASYIISMFLLVSVAEQAGFSLSLSQT